MSNRNKDYYKATESPDEELFHHLSERFTDAALEEARQDRRKLEQLVIDDKGCEIAKWAHWSGDIIIQAFCEALTDANFHTERDKIESLFPDLVSSEGVKTS